MIEKQIFDNYRSIVERSTAFKTLDLDIRSGNSAQSYLFLSPDTLALDILTVLFIAKTSGQDSADGIERILNGNLPDIIKLPRAEKVLTADIEYLLETAYITPLELRRKFYVINNCETMTPAAQNKLLKILEEPPAITGLILRGADTGALLPTVKSRCRILELSPFSQEQTEPLLQRHNADTETRELMLAAGMGRLDIAENILSKSIYRDILNFVFDILLNMRGPSDVIRFSSRAQGYKDYLNTMAQYIECVLHDCLMCGENQPQYVCFESRRRELSEICRSYPTAAILNLMPHLRRTRDRLNNHGNLISTTDELLFSILEVKVKWQRL